MRNCQRQNFTDGNNTADISGIQIFGTLNKYRYRQSLLTVIALIAPVIVIDTPMHPLADYYFTLVFILTE